jgi:DNA modification methylase
MIPYTLLSENSEIAILQAEIDENYVRTQFTWQEEVAALAKLHEKKGGSFTETARAICTSEDAVRSEVGRVSAAVVVGKFLDRPEVAAATSLRAALKIVERIAEKEAAMASAKASSCFFCMDGIGYLSGQKDRFDCILIDPPYGISADKNKTGMKHEYNDSELAFDYPSFFRSAYFACKAQAHLYVFCHWSRFDELARTAGGLGWRVFPTPLLWVKPNTGIAPWPNHGPRRSYDCILYAVKGDKRVIKVLPDVLSYAMDSSKMIHAARKPEGLYIDLLGRSCYPGDVVCDPCAGSGVIFHAAKALKLQAVGVEADPKQHALSLNHLRETGVFDD